MPESLNDNHYHNETHSHLELIPTIHRVIHRGGARQRQSAKVTSVEVMRARQSSKLKCDISLLDRRRLIHRLSTGLLLDSRRTETGAPPSPHPSIVYHSEIDLSRDLRKFFAKLF